ncbi:glycosyltransferase family 4 protein [Aerococcus urinaeequi]|uniref:glycosyltransferase family 4 protein n=1 Tax=Aerococcus urinaeequi TaxID=51665 RepID=UPI003D6C324B
MPKTLFISDHIFINYQGKHYTTGSLSKEILNRYTDIFGDIVVISRQKLDNKIDKTKVSSDDSKISFVEVPDYKNPIKVRNYFIAKKILEDEIRDADYIIARTSVLADMAVKLAKKYNKPYLVEVVGCVWDAMWNYNTLGKLLAPFLFISQKNTVKNAKYVTYVTNDFLQKRYPTSGRSIALSDVELDSMNESILRERLKKISQLNNKSDFVVGTVGAVDVSYKGQQFVIETLAKLSTNPSIEIEYWLVGGGSNEYLFNLSEKLAVSDQVKFLGHMDHSKIFNILDQIDIYIQPSKLEGLPRAVIEAMSRGCLVLGSDVGGIPELIEDEYVFDIGDSQEIGQLIQQLTRQDLIQQAKRNFEESKKYEKNLLKSKREKFYQEFKNKVY